jgi:WhiB family transcriptional regulator, redox-sensing transcriptional regulator
MSIEQALTIQEYKKLHEVVETEVIESEIIEPDTLETSKPHPDASFMKRGRCNDLPPEIMFPHDKPGVEAAKEICRICVVQEVCLDHALTFKIGNGVWGGTSERERRKILKSRRAVQTNE